MAITYEISNADQTPTTGVSDETLAQLGLATSDMPKIEELVSKIDTGNPLTVSEFGNEVALHAEKYSDMLLEQVKNKDLDEAGQQLTEVVLTAKKLNLSALSSSRSRIPIIGGLIDRVRMNKAKLVSQFQSTREQIDTLLAEIAGTQGNLRDRVLTLDDMADAVTEEYRLIGMHIAAGRLKLADIHQQAEGLRSLGSLNPIDTQMLNTLETVGRNLDKRIADLTVMQHSALQSLPMIKMIQQNSSMLVEKFNTISQLTVPAWKRQFMLALSLNEQQNAVQLAETIDNATNDFLLRNAELLHQNTIATAKSNQRLVIDVETLRKVQAELVSAVQEVIKINEDGARQRREATQKIIAMRQDLGRSLVGGAAKQLTN